MVDRHPRPPTKPKETNLQKAGRGKGTVVARLLQHFREQEKKNITNVACFTSPNMAPKNILRAKNIFGGWMGGQLDQICLLFQIGRGRQGGGLV